MADENKMGPPPAGMAAQAAIGDKHPDDPRDAGNPDMVNFCCVLRGDWPFERDEKIRRRMPELGVHYVEQLYSGVSRYAPRNLPWRFVCFTDAARRIEGVPTRPLPEGLHGFFSKLYVFAPTAFPVGQRVVYLDLDTAITGQLDDICRIPLEAPVALSNVWAPGHIGSGLLSFRAGKAVHRFWNDFEQCIGQGSPYSHPNPGKPPPRVPGTLFQWGPMGTGIRTDEQWLMNYAPWESFQKLLPGRLLSYKHEVIGAMIKHMRLPGPPPKPPGWDPRKENVMMVYFHGQPRPHTVVKPWNTIWRSVMDHPHIKVGQGFISEDWEG